VLLFFSSLWWLGALAVNWVLLIRLGSPLVRVGDHGWLDMLGPQGVYKKISSDFWLVDSISYSGFRKLVFGYLIFLLVVLWLIV